MQLDKGIPQKEIQKQFDSDTGFDLSFQPYIDFAIENRFIILDKESGKYTITKYGREFIKTFLAGD